jgi:formate dehydrogenase major subunit
VFIPMAWRYSATTANLLTNDALDPQALIPEFKACAVWRLGATRESELPNPDVVVQRGRY